MSGARWSVLWFQGGSVEKLPSTPNPDSATKSNANPAPYICTGYSTNTDFSSSKDRDSVAAASRESNAADIYCEAEIDDNFIDTRDDDR